MQYNCIGISHIDNALANDQIVNPFVNFEKRCDLVVKNVEMVLNFQFLLVGNPNCLPIAKYWLVLPSEGFKVPREISWRNVQLYCFLTYDD